MIRLMPPQADPPRPLVDPGDFALRWRRARLSALGGGESETERLLSLPEEATRDARKAAGWNSWRLGRSAAAQAGPVDDSGQLARILGTSGIPCVESTAHTSGLECRFQRTHCQAFADIGSLACDFYRDALDGAVCGLSDALRYSRVASRGAGGTSCEDRIYPAGHGELRFASVPEPVVAHLAGPLARLTARGFAIELHGLEENRLVVSVASGRTTACGPDRLHFDLLQSHLVERFPDLRLVDSTPRAVMA